MTSFIVIAWMTTFFAGFEAWEDLKKFWSKEPWRLHHHFTNYGNKPTLTDCVHPPCTHGPCNSCTHPPCANPPCAHSPKLRKPGADEKIVRLLDRLVNLQIATSLAISVAGFTQISSISYYHGWLVYYYWWLTMQSFWMMKMDYAHWDFYDVGLLVRQLAILLSTVLGLGFSIFITVKELEWGDWHYVKGPCYRWSTELAVVIGWSSFILEVFVGLYVIVVVLIIIPFSRRCVLIVEQWLSHGRNLLDYWFCKNYSDLVRLWGSINPPFNGLQILGYAFKATGHVAIAAISGTAVLISWLLIQLLGLFICTELSFYPVL